MGDCPAFIVQATNHITMIAMKQCQANVGLARNTFEIRASDIETRMTATGAPKPDLRYSIYIPGTKIEKRTAYIFYHPGDFYCVTSTDWTKHGLNVLMKSEWLYSGIHNQSTFV